MKGVRPLDNTEIEKVSNAFTGVFEVRNRGLFMLGVSVGGRISELLALTIGDVYQNAAPVTSLHFDKSIVKGGEVSRGVPVNADGRAAIDMLVEWHREVYQSTGKGAPLFPSRKQLGAQLQPMTRKGAHSVLKVAFEAAGLNGKLATHTLRKSFAQRVYNHTGDIYMVQELLGHQNVQTTQRYLGVDYVKARNAVEAMALTSEKSETPKVEIQTVSDDDLVAEIIKRGYAVEKTR